MLTREINIYHRGIQLEVLEVRQGLLKVDKEGSALAFLAPYTY